MDDSSSFFQDLKDAAMREKNWSQWRQNAIAEFASVISDLTPEHFVENYSRNYMGINSLVLNRLNFKQDKENQALNFVTETLLQAKRDYGTFNPLES